MREAAVVGIWRRPVANVMKCLITFHRRNTGFCWCEAVTCFLCVFVFSLLPGVSADSLLEIHRKASGWRCLITSYQWSIDAFSEPHRTLSRKRHLTSFRRPPCNIGYSSAGDRTHIFSEIPSKPESLQMPSSATASELGRSCMREACAAAGSAVLAWRVVGEFYMCKQEWTTTSTKSV